MRFTVALLKSEEGYAVWVPGLPGCCSQGDTEAEALENIADAIKDYLEVSIEQTVGAEFREVLI
jgi:predicted RNase H-like HicB family nuclease